MNVLLLVLLFSQEPVLVINADAAGTLLVDGTAAGAVSPQLPLRLPLTAGEHQLEITAASGGDPWRKLVLVTSGDPTILAVPLRFHRLRAEVTRLGYWRDERSGLHWAATDNGSGVTVSQARSYCQQLATGGFHDWRLPTIDELQPLFGGDVDDRGFRPVAPLKLTGWAWSASEGREPAENWTLDFGDGARASVAAGDAGLNRALCVRWGSN